MEGSCNGESSEKKNIKMETEGRKPKEMEKSNKTLRTFQERRFQRNLYTEIRSIFKKECKNQKASENIISLQK